MAVPNLFGSGSAQSAFVSFHPKNLNLRNLLEWYLESGMWQGKAGACGFQDERLPLRLVKGSGSNVVGLPLERIRTMLVTLDSHRQ